MPRPFSLRIRPRILVATALQAAFLKAAANITAQLATAWKEGHLGSQGLDWTRVAEFSLYGLISASLGFPWQHLLEHHFPTQTPLVAAVTHGSAAVGGKGAVAAQQHDGHDPEKKEYPGAGPSPAVPPLATASQQQQPPYDAPLTPGGGSAPSPIGISWPNVMYKLALDQTLWLLFTTTIFLVCTNALRAPDMAALWLVWREKTWFIIKAAWHVWPLVAICNFAFVPVDYRVLVAACVGFAWNIFLSLISLRNKT